MEVDGVGSPAVSYDAVPVPPVGVAGVLQLHAVEPNALVLGVEHSAADQCLHPGSEIVSGGDHGPGPGGPGVVDAGVVRGLECARLRTGDLLWSVWRAEHHVGRA